MTSEQEARSGRRALSVAVGLVAVCSMAGVAMAGVISADLNRASAEPVVTDDRPTVVVSSVDVPAWGFLDDTLSSAPDGWGAVGQWREGVAATDRRSCEEGPDPVVSGTQVFITGAKDEVIVDVEVHPAGLGAGAFEDRQQGCTPVEVTEPGSEAFDLSSSWQGSSFNTRTWRHGDVVVTMSHQGGRTTAVELSAVMDDHVTDHLAGRCVTPDSTSADESRSPLSAGYVGLHVTRHVEMQEPREPVLVEGRENPSLPGVELDAPYVSVPAEPSYPVWPPMPDEVSAPVAPQVPERPDADVSFKAQVADTDGPGCGWAFTGAVMPPFDREAAQQAGEVSRGRAEARYEDDVTAWQSDVLTYFGDYEAYVDDVADYQEWVSQVAEVSQAWDVIGAQWDAYWVELATYEQEMSRVEAWHERYDAAAARWQEDMQQCLAQQPGDADAGVDPEGEEAEEERPTAPTESGKKPDEEEDVVDEPEPVDCDVEVPRPGILDEDGPSEPSRPSEPADPRP